MKKNIIFFSLIVLLLMSIGTGNAKKLKVKNVEGKLIKALIGNDSCVIDIKTDRGNVITCSFRPNLDWMTKAQQSEYKNLLKTLPGKRWPTILDLNSYIRVWYAKSGNNSNFLLKYQVLRAPKKLWVTIIASKKDSSKAHTLKHKAYTKGFHPDVILSSNHSNLRPGYYVVIVGAFDSKDKAVLNTKKARKMGWKDAYIKRIR